MPDLSKAQPTSITEADEQPLPRPKRQRRRAKADRGLPPDAELSKLAAEYLRVQGKHWPKLVKAGLLPEPKEEVITAMVEDFKHRHRTGEVDPAPLQAFLKHCPKLAGVYGRYSCDNSSPTSIIDQIAKGLEKARQEERFVPWSYVFADYSVSGLNPSRQGYMAYKALLQDKDQLIETTYIDDFTRASRDEVEWWKLAHLSRRLLKRMIGASDGFDLSATNWDMTISVYGLLSRLFIKGLREKVKRGMSGAARRGGCLGKLPLGFTRALRRDDQGNVVRDKDGVPAHVPCIDAGTVEYRKLLYELFVEKCWSPYQITKHFNALKVDGWDGWTELGIKKLLWSATSVGVFLWNKTRGEYDHEEEKWIKIENPRKDWVVYRDPSLAIVPIEQLTKARKKLSAMRRESPLTGRKMSRNEISAKTMFSGTLRCGYCGQEITLMRSAGKYKVMGCINGPTGKHGCKLSASKSTRIIEECLLGYLQNGLLLESAVDDLVEAANEHLERESQRPLVNTQPLHAELRTKETALKKLFVRIEKCDDENLLQAYEKRISQTQKEVNELKARIRAAESQNKRPPAKLNAQEVKKLLPDLRGLFDMEASAAAEAIRALTGPIKIRQQKIPGKERGAKWIATFSPDLLGWLRQRAVSESYPESITLGYLSSRNWIIVNPVEIDIEFTPKHKEIAAEAAEMAAAGAKKEVIAHALNTSWETVEAALAFAKSTSQLSMPRPVFHRRNIPKRDDADDAKVVSMRNQNLSFVKIGKILGIRSTTAAAIYDRHQPAKVQNAARSGSCPNRGRYRNLEASVLAKVEQGLREGKRPVDIARTAGCGTSTVYRERERLGISGREARSRLQETPNEEDSYARAS